jgi:hypothetical protein
MKKLAVLLIAIGGLLSGCIPIPYEGPSGGGGERHGDRDRDGGDRERNGVPNREDSRPNDPHRY